MRQICKQWGFGRIMLVWAAGALLSMGQLESPAFAAGADVPALADDIRQSVLQADRSKTMDERLAAYNDGHEHWMSLSALAADGSPEAKAALSELQDDGINGDTLTSGALSASLSQLESKMDDPDARVALRTSVEELTESLTTPSLKVSALSSYARQLAGDHDAAAGLLQRAINASTQISDLDEKNAALNNIAQVAASVEPQIGSTIVNRTIAGMWPARMRGYARYDVALRLLDKETIGGKKVKEADAGAILAAVKSSLKGGKLEAALLWALAIDPEAAEKRADAVNEVLTAALKANAVNLLPIFATSLADRSDQEDLIVRIVKDRIDANRLVDATAMTANMEAGPGLVEIDFTLASELNDRGLSAMAKEQYQRALSMTKNLNGDEKQAALVSALRSSTDLKLLDEARGLADELGGHRDASNALGNLAKAFADAGDLKEAEALLPRIALVKDQEQALSGIGRAKAKSGDVDEAVKIAERIGDVEDKGRVQSEIARAWARSGQVDDALGLASSIAEPQYRVEALLRVAKEISGKAGGEGKVVDQVVAYVGKIDDSHERDQRLLDIVDYFSKAGQIDRAKQMAEKISDEKLKAKAVGRIASRAVLSDDAPSAVAYFQASKAAADEGLVADVMIAASADPNYMKQAVLAVAKIEDTMLRVRTFRAIAEAQLRQLDRLGFGSGKGQPSDFKDWVQKASANATGSSAATPAALLSDGRMQLRKGSSGAGDFAEYGYPDLSKGASTIRAMLPLPVPGHVALTLGNLSPYLGKFVEDIQDGSTSLSYAARAQGMLFPRIIVVQSGVYTLGSLADQLDSVSGMRLVERQGDTITLRAPILVGEGASLILSGEEASTYRLSATAGAFVIVAGKLYIQDTTVTSWDEERQQPRHSDKDKRTIFRPFIVAWSNSETYIGGSILDSLGYAAPKSFGLSFSAGPKWASETKDDTRRPTGIVVDNYFHNFEYGFYSYEADDISLVGNEYDDNVLYAIDPHDRSRRLLIALNTAHDTIIKHGIIISRNVDDSWKVGNVAFHNNGSGLMLDRSSVGNLIYGNTAFENKQDGLTFFESACNLAFNNAFFDNGRSGIRVRNSWDVAIHDNRITNNKLEAIGGYISNVTLVQTDHKRDLAIDPYVPLTTFAAVDNVISENGNGIKVAGVSGITLAGNRFVNQQGRLLGGDARPFEGHMLRLASQTDVAISSTCRPQRPPADICTFREAGLIGHDDPLFFDSKGPATCTDQRGSVQFGAFHGKKDDT
ncbi:mannuronan C-5-epimerase [Rhizobium sp. Root708]|nr:mannuronan C-5-epimerase [Rhizobium sp. Root708]